MEFTSFTTFVRDEVEKRTGDSYRVRLNDVRKNNGVVLRGLTVMQDDSNIAPTIYLNNYYEEYTNGRVTLINVVNDVMDTYNRNKVNQSIDMRSFLNYESVKQSIVYKLVNTEKNKVLLEDIPHIEFLDLSIVFQCLVSQEDFGTASILIHNVHLKLWDISVDELYRAAKENTQRLQEYEIKSMTDVLYEIMKTEDEEKFDDDDYISKLSDSIPMYVLSNRSRVEGAACMLYPNLIKDFADAIDSSFYIIPSSIHELLLLPAEHDEESREIKSMIREINDTQVSAEEILSYSLYFYDREEGKIIRL
ncbi:MAG: hypothetical protein K2G55_00840 [Lachnospiraceae bacterium]|nr:hypothetical protein [Lachnospiraceae bacterium]MDE7203078.1 hypothetical protein [Lachnospiraceae bacterium]